MPIPAGVGAVRPNLVRRPEDGYHERYMGCPAHREALAKDVG